MVKGTKKLTNNGKGESAPISVGLDVGYGVTKAVAAGVDPITFPSVAGYAREIKFQADEIARRYPGDQIADEDGHWFIGDMALSQLSDGELLRLRGRTANEAELGNVFRVRMAKVALGKMLPNRRNGEAVHIRIATGLPVDHMRDAADLKAALIGTHRIQTDQTDFVANITDVMVMPQPYGTIYSEMLTSEGKANPCHTAIRTGVIDIGTYTVDFTLDDNGEYIDRESGSAEAGVFTVQNAIASAYERDFRTKAHYKDVETIMRSGCVTVRGKMHNYIDVVNEAIDPLRAAVLNKASILWQTAARIDVIYLAGGGAYLIAKDIQSAFPQAQLTENAQLANARGYLNWANFTLLD